MNNETQQFVFKVLIKSNEQILFSEYVKSRTSKMAISNILRTRLRAEKLITEIRCEMSSAQKEQEELSRQAAGE